MKKKRQRQCIATESNGRPYDSEAESIALEYRPRIPDGLEGEFVIGRSSEGDPVDLTTIFHS